ncbi:MAG: GHKL domain-containing protein [bacterium]|nr:GHKL domain-containing protein [bacterium]
MIKKVKDIIYRYRAIFFIVGLASASIVGVIHLFNVSNTHNVELLTRSSIKTARKAFRDLEANTQRMLSATLEALLTNETLAERFAARDREGLYRLVRPFFQEIRRQNAITHMYFIIPEPSKKCFLRVHKRDFYDDVISRATLDTCIKTKKSTYGKELGKTALALRSVHPYFYKGELIGYLELAVRVEDFFKLLKVQTENDFGLLVRKKFLDREKWASQALQNRIRDNWGDLEDHVLINGTCNCVRTAKRRELFDELENMPDEGVVLGELKRKGKHFVRGIFPFRDAAGREVGGVFVLKDITLIHNAMVMQERKIITMLLLFMGLITFFMIFFHMRAERELRKYRHHLEEMVEEATTELRETNIKLNLEIEEHKEMQTALEEECRARAEAEKKQVEAVTQVERSARLASIGVMAAGITHEINQPLNAIKVTADSIQYWHKRNPGNLPEMFVDQLDIISKSVNRIVEIIQHMRTFWVVPHAHDPTPVNINKAVKNALSLIYQQLHAHGIKEQVTITAKPLMVEGDMVHFEQIIANLVVNAIHALDEKKRQKKNIEITTSLDDDKKCAVLIIKDNGPGLPTEDPEKLFDPFFTTHNNSESMGLGLAIVKRYIDRYNGTIEARNNEEAGATFTITFPLSKKENENPADR